MSPLRSFVSLTILSLSLGALEGCKKDEAAATAEPPASASARDTSKLAMRNPMSPVAKIDPATMKEYRVDVCYFGSLTLKQARDAYLASLGKDEPSEKKIPSFGGPKDAKAKDAAAKPAGSGAAATPAAPPAGEAKPAASAAVKPAEGRPGITPRERMPLGMDRDLRRPLDMALRAPHERNARACTVAAGAKDPPMPGIDEAVASFAPFAVDLAKNIAAASTYYQREEYKKDSFAKGKELHKKLVEDFQKLDEHSDKLGAAVAAWRKDHPTDTGKFDEPQKLVQTAFDDGREAMLAIIDKKVDPAAFKANVEKLSKSVDAVKAFGAANANDPWAKITGPAFEGFLKAAKEAAEKVTDKGVDNDSFLSLVTTFTSLIEAKQRGLSRAMIAKGQTTEPAKPNAPATPPPAEQN